MPTRTWWLEYDTVTGTVVLNDKYTPDPPNNGNPNWANVSPDKKTIVFARGHNIFMMDAANFELAKKNAADPAIVRTSPARSVAAQRRFRRAAIRARGRGALRGTV